MTDSHAESLDPSVLGEEVGDDDRPADDYPPEEAVAVEDPSIVEAGVIARDDVETREQRRNPDVDGSVTDPVRDRVADGLIDTNVSPDGNDHEERLIADRGDHDSSPEAGALHIERD
jgi:hypothetical protein